ncbi:SWIM zinc finger family protein [Pseudoxanthomonas winnipegensis]|uniref:SWIM-type domain-containing protein n=1 Tax=Pseudoxanthomonas winnipegensis TaxID=2480810 RepID=A0A4V2HDG4_9GAMM|nr:SWIM zinc finger family protein [Pseudoxanthomonas winnipegensis]TAA26552.1 hypothetical protein EA660_04785 [Pseudoxanthomonas winnipegensis]
MERVEFRVQGTAEDPYVVVFTREGDNITGRCSCPGSRMGGKNCKHRLSILYACTDGIVSGNLDDVARVCGWMAGSDVETALARRDAAEAVWADAKAQLKAAQAAEKQAKEDLEIAKAALGVALRN